MAVDSKFLDAFDAQQKAKAKPATQKAVPLQEAEINDQFLSAYDASAPVEAVQETTTLKAATTGYPEQDAKQELKVSTKTINDYLMGSLGMADQQSVSYDPNIPAPQQVPVDTLQLSNAKSKVKQEVTSASDYIYGDIGNLKANLPPGFDKVLAAKGINLDQFESQAADPSGNTKALQAYMEYKRNALETQRDREAAVTTGPGRFANDAERTEWIRQNQEKKAIADKKYRDELNNVQSAVFGIAAQKVVNEQVQKGMVQPTGSGYTSFMSPYEVGLEINRTMGDGEAERIEKVQKVTGNVNPMDKARMEMQGYQALEYAQLAAAANDDEATAKALAQQTKDWQTKLLDNNPEFAKRQAEEAISQFAADKAKNSGYALSGYVVDENDIKEWAEKYNVPDKYWEDINPEDIKRISNPFARFSQAAIVKPGAQLTEWFDRRVSGLMGVPTEALDEEYPQNWWATTSIGRSTGGVAPDNLGLFKSETVVNPQFGSKDFLFTVDNPEYDKNSLNFNPSVASIIGTVSEGAGQVIGLGKGSQLLGGAFKAAKVIKGGQAANAAGLMSYTALTTYDDNYRQSVQDFGDKPEDESKRVGTALLRSFIEGGTELILPDYNVAQKIFATKAFKEGVVDLIREKGMAAVTRDVLQNTLAKAAKETGVDVLKESGEEIAGVYANSLVDMVSLPDKYAETNYNQEAVQQGIAAGISSLLPVGAGNVMQSKQQQSMYKYGMYMAGSNPTAVVESIDKELADGEITPEVANEKKNIVARLAEIVSSTPDVSPETGKPLTGQQKVDYVSYRLSTNLLEQAAKKVEDDKVMKGIIEAKIKENESGQSKILKNAGPSGPVEESPQNVSNNESSNEKVGDNQKGDETQSVVSQERNGSQNAEEEGLVRPAGESVAGQQGQSVTGTLDPALFDFTDLEEDEEVVSLGESNNVITDVSSSSTLPNEVAPLSEEQVAEQESSNNITESISEGEQINVAPQASITEASMEGGEQVVGGASTNITEQTIVAELPNVKDEINNTPLLKSAESNYETLYVPRSIVERAYSNDEANNGSNGGKLQPLDTIIRRGGYTISEMNKLYPNWRNEINQQTTIEDGTTASENNTQGIQDNTSVEGVRSVSEGAEQVVGGVEEAGGSVVSETNTGNESTQSVGENIRQRFSEAPKVEGRSFSPTLPTGEKMRGKYLLVPANSVTPSHNPRTFATSEGYPMLEGDRNPNDRDYTLDKNKSAVIARSQDYDGRAVDNVPTIDANGVVIDGNDRTMAGQLAAEQGTDGAYIQSLIENAEKYGFTPEQVQQMVENGEHPRVVFMTDTVQPYTTETFAKFNVSAQKTKSALETAIQLSRTLPGDVVSRIGTIMERHDTLTDLYKNKVDSQDLLNILKRGNVVTQNNVSQFFDDNTGSFTAEGKALISNVMLSQILSEESLRIIQLYPSLQNKVTRAAKNVLAIDARGKYGLAETLDAAVVLYHNVEVYRESMPLGSDREAALEQYLNQNTLFPDDGQETSAQIQLYQTLANPAIKALQNHTKEMLDRSSPANSGFDLFGELPPSKLQLILNANKAAQEYEKSQQAIPVQEAEPIVTGNEPGQSGTGDNQATETVSQEQESTGQEDNTGTISESESVPGSVIDERLLPINSRIEESISEVARLESLIELKAEQLDDMRKRGQGVFSNPLYQGTQKVYNRLIEQLKEAKREQNAARKEYDAVAASLAKKKTNTKRKEVAKKAADTVRSKKVKKKKGGNLYAADPFTATLQLAKVVGIDTWNASLELVAQAIEKGTSLRIAIENGVSYLREKARGSEEIVPDSDYDAYRRQLGYYDENADEGIANETQAQTNERLFRQKNIDSKNKLSDRQFTQAEAIIKGIQEGRITLADAIASINTKSEATKEKIAKHISSAINGDPNKFLYDDNTKRIFQEDVRQQVSQRKKFNEILSRLESQRERKLTFEERQFVAQEIDNYDEITKQLSETSKLTKDKIRGVIRRIADSAYVNDDIVLADMVDALDKRYEPETHKDLEEYAKAIVDEFGPAQAERMAIEQSMKPNHRQAVLGYVAQAYRDQNNFAALESVMNRIAQDATAYGQGVEAVKLVYQILGLAGSRVSDTYIQSLVATMQEKYLAAHQDEINNLKKQINELRKETAQKTSEDKALAEKVLSTIRSGNKKSSSAQKKSGDARNSLGNNINKKLKSAQGKLETPQQIEAMRKEIERAIRNAYPLLDESDLNELVSDALARFDENVKELNEGNLYEFYKKVMFPQSSDGDFRDTRIAEEIASVVNSAMIVNGKIDDHTLDAISQKYKIDLRSNGFVRSLNLLVESVNEDELNEQGKPSRLKDNIADLLRVYNVNRISKDAMMSIGESLESISSMAPKKREAALGSIRKYIEAKFNSLSLSNWKDRETIVKTVTDRIEKAAKERASLSADEKLARYYNEVMRSPLPTDVKTDKDTRVADKIMSIVNASNVLTPGQIDQLTIDALQREFDITFAGPQFIEALNQLVEVANAQDAGKGIPSRMKDDVAQLVRLYSIENATDLSIDSLAQNISEIATKLASIRNGSLASVVDYVQKELSKLGVSPAEAQNIVSAVKDRYETLLRQNADKFLKKSLGDSSKPVKEKQTKEQKSFYDQVVAELSAMQLSDVSFQQLFAEKYGLKPLTEEDYRKLNDLGEKIEKWYKIAPNSVEYGAAIEKFFNIINEKSPEYLTNVFNGLRAAKVLGSIYFTAKTIVSNVSQIYTRGLTEYARSVMRGRPDAQILRLTFPNIQRLFGGPVMDKMATEAAKYIARGGVPVSNLYEMENAKMNAQGVNTRLEEFANPQDGWYIRASKWVTKMGSRVQNTVDSYGQLRTQEANQYARIVETVESEMKQVNPAVANDEIIEEARKRFELTDKQEAIDKAREQYNEMGIEVDENSARFKLRVAEIRRENRDAESLQFAREKGRIDFWKETDRSAGRASAGLGGVFEELLTYIRDKPRTIFEKNPKGLAAYDAAAFQVVGFIGGTTRFLETSLEHILPYSAGKALWLQVAKKDALTPQEKEAIDKKQFDVIFKGFLGMAQTSMYLAGYYTLKALAAGEGEDDDRDKWGIYGGGDVYTLDQVQAYKGLPKNGFLINGHKIPFEAIVPEQGSFWMRLYANVEDYARTDEESVALSSLLLTGWNTIPQSPLSAGTIGSIMDVFNAQNNEKKLGKAQELLYAKAGNYVAGFVPIFQRLVTEAWQTFDQRQMVRIEPTASYERDDSKMETLGKFVMNTASRAMFSTGQALGFNNLLSTANILNKPAVDYRGREVNMGLQYSSYSSFPTMLDGDAITYDVIDDVLAKAGTKINYYSRYGSKQVLFLDKQNDEYYYENDENQKVQIYEGRQRPMTDQEFYDFNVAIGKMNALQLQGKETEWTTETPAEDIKSDFNEMQRNSYDYAKKGIENGLSSSQIIERFQSGETIELPEPDNTDNSF